MEHKEILVIKRDGTKEKFNVEKINKVVSWAIEGLSNVSLSEIEINLRLNLKNDITTKEIHSVLIDTVSNLISLKSPDYQYVASRLLNYHLRKDVWGGKNAPKFLNFIEKGIKVTKVYEPALLDWYSKEEINKLDEAIVHQRDLDFTYAGIRQLCDKYLVQNRETKELYETPGFMYMLIAMTVFHKYDKKYRLDYVKKAYNYFSKHKINLPTPLMAGVRTTMRSFASCTLIDTGDSMDSIFASVSAVGHATAKRYGIGLNMGRIRAINTPIRNGEVMHTGVVPFLKIMEAAVKCSQQSGLRGGSATVNFPIWHYEIQDILQLKNNSGTDENRARRLDYSIALSKLFYDRFLKDGSITLFSPHEVKDLYDSFGLPEFDELYVKYEKDKNIKYKKIIGARELFSLLVKERIETGRIYIMNIDHVNQHGAFEDKVHMSNLCVEITQPTIPLKSYEDADGEIGVCILSAINWLEIQSDAEFEKVCDIIVRMLDEIIDYQDYFNTAARNFATKRRSLGIGITNLAAFLAKNELKYGDKKALTLVDEYMEKQQFFLLKASVNLAKEKGKCEKFDRVKYARGIFSQDTAKAEVFELCTRKPSMDWDYLREEVKKYGLRHSTLTAIMPVESSSLVQNATNGIEPPRSLISFKKSKARTIPMIVPNAEKWGNRYTLAYQQPDNIGYMNIAAIIQKWVDMALSTNVYYSGVLDDSKVLKEILYFYKVGGKCAYYLNTDDGNKQSTSEIDGNAPDLIEEDKCASGSCTL